MKHLIKKQEFLLIIHPGVEAFGVQHAASRYYRDKLLPILERVFDELSGEDEVIHIDRLFIDLGEIGERSLESGLGEEGVYAAIKEELLKVVKGESKDAGLLRQPLRVNALAQWWYYMEKGRLPWNAGGVTGDWYDKVLETFSVDFGSVTRLRLALREEQAILERISYQHTDGFLETLTGILTGVRQTSLGKMVAAICTASGWLEEKYREGIHGLPWFRERRPGDGKEALPGRLRRWAMGHRGFLQLPANHRKTAVWQFLLWEAAGSAEAFNTRGAAKLLARWISEDGLILRFLLEAGPALPGFPFSFREGVDRPEDRTAEPAREEGMEQGREMLKQGPGTIKDDTDEEILKGPEEVSQERRDNGGREVQDGAGSEERDGTGTEGRDKTDIERGEEDSREGPDEDNKLAEIDTGFSAGQVDEEGIYCIHAGLILLHPFLSTLFSRLKLWDGGGFVDLAARQQAVFLLHFLATGEREGPEYEMVFAKMLCGYGLETPLRGGILLTEEECVEGEVLLQSALIRWEKLPNTTIAGLREGFLQRGGKLVNRHGRLVLLVEISAIDVLLDYLPWNLGIVKLPWLKDLLYVEWR